MNLTTYNSKISKMLVPKDLRTEQGRLVGAIQSSRNGSSLRHITCKPEGEEFQGKFLRTSQDKRRLLIGLTLVSIARSLGAKGEIPQDVVRFCVDFVEERYLDLSIEEIKEAFKMACAGELDIKSASLFQGTLNAEWLGRILSAYKRKRVQILQKIEEAEERFSAVYGIDEKAEFARRDRHNKNAIERICKYYEEFRAKKEDDCKVPVLSIQASYYLFLKKIGVFAPSKESVINAFNNAKGEALRKIAKGIQLENNPSKKKRLQDDLAKVLQAKEKLSLQKQKGMSRIFCAWFAKLDRIGIDPEILNEGLLRIYETQSESLYSVRYNVILTSFAGNQREYTKIDRTQLEEILRVIGSKINHIDLKLS